MTAAQITALVVSAALASSIASALACVDRDSNPADVLSAASRNAAATISYLGEED